MCTFLFTTEDKDFSHYSNCGRQSVVYPSRLYNASLSNLRVCGIYIFYELINKFLYTGKHAYYPTELA